MMFADDIVICSESREQVEENLERRRFALERRGMKVSRSKTEYMCVNEREGSGTVRLQGEEVKKVQEFKYLGSTVQSNGECGKEVKKRVQAGWNGWRKVSGVLCDRKISENQGEGVQDSGETSYAVWFRDSVTEEETGVRARDLEKAYDRVPREELWYCMRKSGVAEKYVRVVQDMYERSRTVVRCAVVMDQLSEEVRQESPWTMMFADDIVICSESREQVEENLERWRFALERRGIKEAKFLCWTT
ncbi:hypothetical protein QTP86_004043 [Hemibagrus guttatus]|nr:hypothetical protein QTP86_004043 [Hemibagrus guttatus]